MEKKTIGAFIAALRKAKGLTQQDVAERLNISNKAVSRWERDECAPDISLIPAIAELLEVTCDELLKGERILDTTQSEKSEPKVEKQLTMLINREMSKFKTFILIALALAIAGFVGILCITYGFYRPVIGFCVLILFELSAVILTVIAVNKMNETKDNSELFNCLSDDLKRKYKQNMGQFIYTVISTVVSVIALSLPLLLASDGYVIPTWNTYSAVYFLPIVLTLGTIVLITYNPCTALLSGQEVNREKNCLAKPKMMSILQLLSLFIAGLLLILSPYTIVSPESYIVNDIMAIIAIIFLCLDIIFFITFMIKYKSERKESLLPGIRNLLLIIPIASFSGIHSVGFYSDIHEVTQYVRHDLWNMKWGAISLTLALGIIAVFQLMIFIKKRKHNKYKKSNVDLETSEFI